MDRHADRVCALDVVSVRAVNQEHAGADRLERAGRGGPVAPRDRHAVELRGGGQRVQVEDGGDLAAEGHALERGEIAAVGRHGGVGDGDVARGVGLRPPPRTRPPRRWCRIPELGVCVRAVRRRRRRRGA